MPMADPQAIELPSRSITTLVITKASDAAAN